MKPKASSTHQLYKEGDPIFDGLAHRGFDEKHDGWMNTQIQPGEFSAIKHASSILDMAEEINDLRAKLWHAEQDLAMLRPLIYGKPYDVENEL